MNAALDMNSVAFDSGYQATAIIGEVDSASAFDIDLPVVMCRRSYFRPLVAAEPDKTVTMTDLLVREFDSGQALARELSEKAKQAQADRQTYKLRIEALRADAAQDGYRLNAASELDFWHFVRSEPFIRKGNLVLLDNGNLRVLWRDERGTHIGLQFLGSRTIQYVIFKQRGASGAISRVNGRDSFNGVKRQIQAFDLRRLMYA